MNAFYAGTLLMLLPSVTTLRILKQVNVHPIRLQQAFHTTWFTVEIQVVGRRIDVIYIYNCAPMNVERWSPFLKTRS